MRIVESNAKWIFCDSVSVPQCLEAAKQVDWPVEVIVFGQTEGCTSVDTLFVPVEHPNGIIQHKLYLPITYS